MSAPVQRIFSASDLASFEQSEAYARVLDLIVRCNSAVKGKKRESPQPRSEIVSSLTAILDAVQELANSVDLDKSPQRFGNRAFRAFIAQLEATSLELHNSRLASFTSTYAESVHELVYYFNNSFGNSTRIDYGSGHELNFLAYVIVLFKCGVLKENQDEEAVVFVLFEKYLQICRNLQLKFRLEPAGSKGVWGLEDHQFLNFLWGSSQLIGQESSIPPSLVLSPSRLTPSLVSSYLYISSISHILTLKRGPFAEHSPMLHNIASTVPNWTKVNSGLIKMYKAEVLGKIPVVQHFWFGDALRWKMVESGEDLPSSGRGRAEEDGKGVDTATGTKAPWATNGESDALSMPATAAPWANKNGANTVTAVPWSLPPQSSRMPVGSSAIRQTMAATGNSLRNTGSAAAMSSPMGAIAQARTDVNRK